ncbi:MAG: NAD(P)/FAD-dependent oxidoreductase, partial [Bermanella sp.]
MKPKLVLIGNGMAGAKLLEELMASCADKYDISVFGNEPYGNYNRIMLSPLLAGEKTLQEIMVFDRPWYQEHGIALHVGPDK